MAPLTFTKAERTQTKLKIGLQGPSGSGKTEGALNIARAIVGPTGKIALADTEAGSASLYADRFDFDTIRITPPYLSSKFEEIIDAAVEAGYDALVIDSISHQWAGDGGILSRKEELDTRGGNSYTNWAKFTKEHNRFLGKILNAPIHIICTLRAKQDYVLEAGANGKQTPKKVGMAAVQRDGAEYEFTLNLDLQMDHKAKASKDRTDLFNDELIDLRKPDFGKRLTAWLSEGKELPTATTEQRSSLEDFALVDWKDARIATRIRTLLGNPRLTESEATDAITKLTELSQNNG